MATIVFIHHALGLTPGLEQITEHWRVAGHDVVELDVFDGQVFTTLDEGLAYAAGIDPVTVARDFSKVLDGDSPEARIVFAGVSWGVLIAQQLAQLHFRAAGALLFEAALPISDPNRPTEWAFGPWPPGLPGQIHAHAEDPIFIEDGDLANAQAIVTASDGAVELFLYPGNQHLYLDSTLPTYDADATALTLKRADQFLDSLG